jgi:hypothetical protein
MELSEFRSDHSAEQKTLGIPFQTVPQRRKKLRIPFRGEKIVANYRNSIPRHALDKNMLSILFLEQDFL